MLINMKLPTAKSQLLTSSLLIILRCYQPTLSTMDYRPIRVLASVFVNLRRSWLKVLLVLLTLSVVFFAWPFDSSKYVSSGELWTLLAILNVF